MKIITLLENETISKEYINKHGLSIYIETNNKKILFDTGPDKSFALNADKKGVKLDEVDLLVISHGHYDHGGGIEEFLKRNNKAKIYIGKGAFDDYYVRLLKIFKHYIGLKKELENNSRFIIVEDKLRVDNNIVLFGNVDGKILLPKGNKKLLMRDDEQNLIQDDFKHEISMIIGEESNYALFIGCSHNGIINIISKAKNVVSSNISTVIGGMHLMNIRSIDAKNKRFLDELTNELDKQEVNKYYTCHCTGERAYDYLKVKLSNLNQLNTGMSIEV